MVGVLRAPTINSGEPYHLTQISHHSQKRYALLRMVRVLAAHHTAKTRFLRKVQDLSKISDILNERL